MAANSLTVDAWSDILVCAASPHPSMHIEGMMLCDVMLCCVMFCNVMLCYDVLCYIMLCCVLCYVMLYSVTLSYCIVL